MAHLTLLSPIVPYPSMSGGSTHIMQAIRRLARAYQVDLCALTAERATPMWGPLAQICASVTAFPRGQARWGFAPPAVRQEHAPELVAHLRRAWDRRPPDIVQIEYTSMAQYAPLARAAGALVVCTAHNIAFLAQARRARREYTLPMRTRRWLGALSLWRYELRMLPYCHLVVVFSADDAVALRRWLPGLPVAHVPSGVALDERSVCFDPRAENEVLFVGSYQHPPNVEGARWLANEVWPRVRQARPSARLTLAGRAPPPEILALAGQDIRVPGALDDLRPCYARASLVVAPIFWGSGVRIKILDALAHGMPLVTTPMGAEGIDLVPGQHALFAERPDDFAAAIVYLLDDLPLRARLGAAGRALIERAYDWDRIGARLVGLYEGARAGLRREG